MADNINFDYDADEVINDFKSKIKWPKAEEVEAVITPDKMPLRIFLAILATALSGGVAYYFMLPVINFKSVDFYEFILLLIALFVFFFGLFCNAHKKVERKEYVKKKSVIPGIIALVVVGVMAVGWLVGATVFRAKDYSEIMKIQSADFSEDFSDIRYDKVPRLDSSTALTLADQQLGSLSEYKSQYVVSNTTTQINVNDAPVRVAYLEYADVFKWFNNTKNGLPSYMIIDVISQKVSVINLKEGMKYSPTELFNEKLKRHLRFQYPTEILDESNFEIDDNKNPYWITAVLDKTIGLFGGTDVKGAIITDAITGESTYYDIKDVPLWVDRVYSDTLLLQQYNYYGKYNSGFWNSIIFQDNVTVSSPGNGYIAMDDDVWLYTGITSMKSDTSNFGFILCNQRTKESRYYQQSGAIEEAAQKSAKDALQNYGYDACFPILLQIEGQPTYFMSMIGSSNTVKGYALVNLDDKTIVGTGVLSDGKSDARSLNQAVENYVDALKDKGLIDSNISTSEVIVDEEEQPSGTTEAPAAPNTNGSKITGTVSNATDAVIDGNTYCYFEVSGVYYYVKAADCMEALFIQNGDNVEIKVKDGSGKSSPIEASSIIKK